MPSPEFDLEELHSHVPEDGARVHSLAVFPLANLCPDHGHDDFAHGMTADRCARRRTVEMEQVPAIRRFLWLEAAVACQSDGLPCHLSVIRGTFMHWSHHRGQFTVYLRMNGVPVPAI